MRFLYCRSPTPLENLCERWHFTDAQASAGIPISNRLGAVACKCILATCYMRRSAGRSTEMFDLIMLAIGLGLFALSVGYVYACDQL